MVLLVMGLPGSGKSFFAIRLARQLRAVYINSDRTRKELLTIPSYTDEEKMKVYDEMLRQTQFHAGEGRHVVVDATFSTAAVRGKFTQGLRSFVETTFIEIEADETLIRDRLQHPREFSDANFDTYNEIKKEWQPLKEHHLLIRSSDSNLEAMLDEALVFIKREVHDKDRD